VPNKTIFVRDEDLQLWHSAEQHAIAERSSVSAVVAAALRSYLADLDGYDTITLDKILHDGEIRQVSFKGRWLATQVTPDGDDGGIAETARGRIAIYYQNNDDQLGRIRDFDDLPAAHGELGHVFPEEVWNDALAALVLKTPVELDI
jgi:hypothetical protein